MRNYTSVSLLFLKTREAYFHPLCTAICIRIHISLYLAWADEIDIALDCKGIELNYFIGLNKILTCSVIMCLSDLRSS
jgi:hypothetical protein